MIALDGVSDPGNLGTIIRVADWYGIKHIVASTDCADPYNPKTISATMGSFGRVTVTQLDLPSYLEQSNLPVYGAFLEGESTHSKTFSAEGILLMGSESHGVREEAAKFVTDKITIPAFGGAESLNVAMATGIILDNIKRQNP
ncbi:tRNA (guanosine(18)-2'-O)-methyltransferase [Vibrio ishigakensis]|uniref:tRNA (Guanosine(18)-2'-O)-methyltransferase n=2 Tax=Vibrio ishigakensis TaxID=1481914 RepID=A0A0B8Q3C4_9VIBR|nr:tRNA (guanosine(18)-2'-O)-methyltransferase [Vibrio ishigakensis]